MNILERARALAPKIGPRPFMIANARAAVGLASCSVDSTRPVMVHLVVTRRCNLECAYCYEADATSPMVAIADLKRRVDELKRLKTVFVTPTGGEPLLHPDIVELVRYIRLRGMVPMMNSNGLCLDLPLILALNQAGLYAMQLSLDNIEPTEVSRKSYALLRENLELLKRHATFRVRVNTVLTADRPKEAVEVTRRLVAMGFETKCSFERDAQGGLMPLSAEGARAYHAILQLERRTSAYLSEDHQLSLMGQGKAEWKCRSGARYFTVCEDGLVYLCESSYGEDAKPLSEYGEADIRAAFNRQKSCAKTCAVAYAHQISRLDRLRPQPLQAGAVVKGAWVEEKRRSQIAINNYLF